MRALLLVLLGGLVLAPAAQAQQTGSEQQRRAALQARRDSLEAEVVQKFVERLTRDLQLTAAQRTQLEEVLRQSGLRRRELSRASAELRGRMYRAVRSSAGTDAEFLRLLTEHETLRGREHDLWRRDQEELAAILSPRQRTQFLLSWTRFQDDMRDILSRRMREQGGPARDRRSDGSH